MSVLHPHHAPIARQHAAGHPELHAPRPSPQALLEAALAELRVIEDAIVHNGSVFIVDKSVMATRISALLAVAQECGLLRE